MVQQSVTVFVSSDVCFNLPFIFKKKTLIIALRLEFDDDVTCSETLVTCLKRDRTHLLHEASCEVFYSV